MKTKSKALNLIWNELQDIFLDFKKFKKDHILKLEKLGFKVTTTGKHPKITIDINGRSHAFILSSSPSDRYAGRQILRQIRSIYEREDEGGKDQ